MKGNSKNQNEKYYNKQISTNDHTPKNKGTLKLFEKQYSYKSEHSNIKNQKQADNKYITNNNFVTNIEKEIKRTDSEKNLLNAIKETENLNNILNEKTQELENNKKNFTKELLLINNNIKEKSIQLDISSNNSKIIINQLNQLNLKINEEYQKIKLSEFVNKSENDKMNSIIKNNNNKIKNAKKQIIQNNAIINKLIIHKEKLEKIVESDKNSILKNLKNKLEELNKSEKELKAEIEKMKLMKENHEKKCDIIIKELEQNLERIKKEYNFGNKIKELNKSPSKIKQLPITKKNMNSLPNIHKNIIILDNEGKKTIEQSEDNKIMTINKGMFIQKDFVELQDQIKTKIKLKSKQNIKNYINSRNKIKKEIDDNYLFSEDEKNLLKDFIPMEILDVYQNKFQIIKEENNKIFEIIKKNKFRNKIIAEKNQIEFIKNKKEHNIQKKNIELNSKILLLNKEIKKLDREKKELQKELEKININYNTKKRDNDKYRETWISLYNDINNKKIIAKKGETVTEEELMYIDKFGKINEKDGFSNEKKDKNESDIIELNAT